MCHPHPLLCMPLLRVKLLYRANKRRDVGWEGRPGRQRDNKNLASAEHRLDDDNYFYSLSCVTNIRAILTPLSVSHGMYPSSHVSLNRIHSGNPQIGIYVYCHPLNLNALQVGETNTDSKPLVHYYYYHCTVSHQHQQRHTPKDRDSETVNTPAQKCNANQTRLNNWIKAFSSTCHPTVNSPYFTCSLRDGVHMVHNNGRDSTQCRCSCVGLSSV